MGGVEKGERKMLKEEETVPVEDVAKALKRGPDLIKRGIRQRKFPFGVYIAPEKDNQKHAYIITKRRFEAWLERDEKTRFIQWRYCSITKRR